MENLRSIRKELGFTQKVLAAKINVSQQCYSDYETGKTDPDIKTLILIADALNVSTDYLLGRTDELGGALVSNATRLDLTDDEKDLLKIYRAMSHPQKIRLVAYGEGLVGTAPSSARN